MKPLVKVLRTIGNTIALILGVKGEYRKEAEAEFKRDHKKALTREALAEKEKAEKTPALKKEKPIKPKKEPQHDEGASLFTWDD